MSPLSLKGAPAAPYQPKPEAKVPFYVKWLFSSKNEEMRKVAEESKKILEEASKLS